MQAALEVALAFKADSDQGISSKTSSNPPQEIQSAEISQQSDLKSDVVDNNTVALEKPVKRDFSAFCDCV
jgi:hypothetical protein